MNPIDAFLETIEDSDDQVHASVVLNSLVNPETAIPRLRDGLPADEIAVLVDFMGWSRETDMEDYAE